MMAQSLQGKKKSAIAIKGCLFADIYRGHLFSWLCLLLCGI